MKWSRHISSIVSKASQEIGALSRQRSKLSRSKLEQIYLVMIRPSLEYGSIVLAGCSSGDASSLEGVQRGALVLCSGALRRTDTSRLNDELGWRPGLLSALKL